MTDDFEPGEVLYYFDKWNGRTLGPYTVRNPVRTGQGKLRLIGPRGGEQTTWWTRTDSTIRSESR